MERSAARSSAAMTMVRGCGFRVIWRVLHDATETAREWLATHLSEGSTTSGIVDDVGDNTLDVAMTLSEVLGVGRRRESRSARRSDFSLWAAALEKSASDGVPVAREPRAGIVHRTHRPRDIVRRCSMQPKPPSEAHDRRARTGPQPAPFAWDPGEIRVSPCRSLRRKTRRSIAVFGRDDAHLLTVLGGALALVGVARENRAGTLTLTADNATHPVSRGDGGSGQGQDAALSLRWERRVEMFVGGGDGNARPTPMRGSRARPRRVHDGGEVGRVTMLTCLNGGTTSAP